MQIVKILGHLALLIAKQFSPALPALQYTLLEQTTIYSMASKQGGKSGAVAAKSKKNAKPTKPTKAGADESREDVLQAVVRNSVLQAVCGQRVARFCLTIFGTRRFSPTLSKTDTGPSLWRSQE